MKLKSLAVELHQSNSRQDHNPRIFGKLLTGVFHIRQNQIASGKLKQHVFVNTTRNMFSRQKIILSEEIFFRGAYIESLCSDARR